MAAAPGRVTVCPPAGQGGAHSAPDDQATRQDRALALLRAALDDPQHADPVATYLDLCRGHGAELRPGTLAHASFWTALAAVVRERCAQEPALRRAFDAADLGRWSPFPRPAPPPPPSAPALDGTPTGRETWSVDGYAVLPAGREGADDPLLVVQKGKLLRVDPADGRVLWSTDLPEQTRPAGWNPAISLPPRQHSSIGMPAYVSTPGGVMVALPSGFLSVDPADGALRWARDAGWHWAQSPVTVRVPRQELVQRVRHGLPIPPGPGDRLQLLDGFAASPSVAARLLAGRGLQAVDPAGGTPLLDVQGESRAEFTGARVAAVGTGLAALLQQPERLLYYDLRGEDPLAEWRFRSAGFVRSMLAGPDEVLYVADYDGVYRLDLARMSLTDRWFVEGGVDGLLSADKRALLLTTLDGRLLALNAADGSLLLERAADGATPVWAERSGDVLNVLEAAELREPPGQGQPRQYAGRGFVLRALRMADGGELWHMDWPDAGPLGMTPPRRAGGLYLLRSTQPGQVRLAGVEAATGRQAFSVALKASSAPGRVALLVRGGRVLLGFDARLVALAMEGGVE